MDIIDLMENRYSCKQFEPNRKLTNEQLLAVESLLQLAPSSTNLQPWHFVIANTQIGKEKIATACKQEYPTNVAKILDSCITVVFSCKARLEEDYLVKLLQKEASDGRFINHEAMSLAHQSRCQFSDMHIYKERDFQHWTENQLFLNLGSFLVGVAMLGLDSICIEGIDKYGLDSLLNLNEKGFTSCFVVAIGYASPNDPNVNVPKSRFDKKDIIERI
ncbi:oxygen-insensitive NAD(P)H nitroreductase [Tannockella kyphosi]|uniref:oxygen-insensitive NAD(P)H nitroreductase n=1 Tax=Tannockella kyphosi TaxID=2899121 RepID=UPI0020139F3A|nr:oxygen-insensitive NAD(P)H nitroreductase [Tannockella kyphosi]